MLREDIRKTRRRANKDEKHVLAVLSLARDADGKQLSEERIISEAIGLLIAGHETSAATGSWLGIWLQQKPEINKKLADSVLASIQEEGQYNPEKIVELPYVVACLNESQRLTPSAVGFIRWLREDTKLGDLVLPAGSAVLPNVYLTHRRKDIYGEDALEFRPERWLEGNRYGPTEFLPFGGGRRACIGLNQGKQQLRVIFSELARRVDFTSAFQNTNTMPRSRMIGGQTEPEKGVMLTVKNLRPADYGYPQASSNVKNAVTTA